MEVEPAYEAGETRIDKKSAALRLAISPPTELALCQSQDKQKVVIAKRKDVVVLPPKGEVDMKVFSRTEGPSECVQGAPSKDPLGTGCLEGEK
jgi:hypothetical protein